MIRFSIGATLLLSSVSVIPLASAQTQAPVAEQRNDMEGLDAIIVTGEKIDRSIQDTPTSVRVVTAKEMERENLISVYDAIARTANLSSTNDSSFTIRGIANQNITGQGTGELATVYLDGSPLPSEALSGPLELWDLAQIEILRGPQSTLQGRNALAGAIILKTTDPTFKWSGKARAIITDKIEERRFGAALGGPIIADQLAFRVAGEHVKTNGLIRNITRDDDRAGLKDSDNIRGKLLFTPTALPGLRILASWLHDRHKSGESYSFTDVPNAWTNRTLEGNRPTINHVKSDIGTFDLGYDLTDALSLSAVTTWARIRNTNAYDGDNLPVDQAYGDFSQDRTTVTQEVRLNYQSDNFTGLIGGYFSHVSNKKDRASSTFSISPVDDLGLPAEIAPFYPAELFINTAQAYPQTIRNLAAFGDATWTVAPHLKLRAGFRYDEEKQARANNNSVVLATALPNPADFGPFADTIGYVNSLINGFVAQANSSTPAAKTRFRAFLPKAGITYEVNDDLSFSGTVQRGYRSGGSGVNPGLGQLYSYKPEYTWNYEVALRSLWLNRTLSVNANAFYIDWTDQQVIYYPPPQQTYNYFTRNAGTSRVYGFELETRYQPSRAFSLYASVGHSNTKFTNFVIGADDYSGNEFPKAPKWTLAAGATWEGENGWFVNLNANHRSSAYQDIGGQDRRDMRRHTLVNAKIGWHDDHFGAFLTGTNLLNAKYFDYRYVNGTREQSTLGEPRVLGVLFEARF